MIAARSVSEAAAALAAGDATVLAGGTDLYPALDGPTLRGPVVDIAAIDELRRIAAEPGPDGRPGWRIGAAVTWRALERAALPPQFDALKAAGRSVGSVQIQNVATLVGNLCNASPAADGAPTLLALDAEIELVSAAGGLRRLPLDAFLIGPRRTARRPDELATAVWVPDFGPTARTGFEKLGARKYLVISIAMAAATLALDGAGRVATARAAVGACSARAVRLPALEAALIGARARAASLTEMVTEARMEGLAPIDDMRGTAAYRRAAAVELMRRALATAAAARTREAA